MMSFATRVALALLMPSLVVGCSRFDAPVSVSPGNAVEGRVPVPQPDRPVDTGELTVIEPAEAVLQRDDSMRRDPFARLDLAVNRSQQLASTTATGPAFCPLQLTGVARMNGRPQAFVDGDLGAGRLREGDVGGESTNLLAPGLRVNTIDVASRQLSLAQEHGDGEELVCKF